MIAKSWKGKRLSDLTELEFLDFYKSIPDDRKMFLLMTDCKQLTYAVDRIQKYFPPKKVPIWKFWKDKCKFCNCELLHGRTLHCGKNECWVAYQKENI